MRLVRPGAAAFRRGRVFPDGRVSRCGAAFSRARNSASAGRPSGSRTPMGIFPVAVAPLSRWIETFPHGKAGGDETKSGVGTRQRPQAPARSLGGVPASQRPILSRRRRRRDSGAKPGGQRSFPAHGERSVRVSFCCANQWVAPFPVSWFSSRGFAFLLHPSLHPRRPPYCPGCSKEMQPGWWKECK